MVKGQSTSGQLEMVASTTTRVQLTASLQASTPSRSGRPTKTAEKLPLMSSVHPRWPSHIRTIPTHFPLLVILGQLTDKW